MSSPLAGIDEGDKIRTIYNGSVGGANDTIRNQTVERTAPTVLDGVQALHWLQAAEEGPPSQGVSGPKKEVVKPPPEGWLWPEPGTRWAAQGGRHQGPPESEGPQEGSAQSYAWQPFYSGSSTHFSLKWIGTSSLWMTSCGCFAARGQ